MKKIILALLILGGFAACKSKTKATASSTTVQTPSIAWLGDANLKQAKTQATASGKPIFVDIGTEWCGYCKKMKKSIFTNSAVASAMNAGFVPLSLDGERGDGRSLVAKLGITGFPTQLILDAKGNVLKKNVGYLDASELVVFLK